MTGGGISESTAEPRVARIRFRASDTEPATFGLGNATSLTFALQVNEL